MSSVKMTRRDLIARSAAAAVAAIVTVPMAAGASPLPANFSLLEVVNQERTSRGIDRLTWNPNLNDAAQTYSRVVRRAEWLSHGFDGTNVGSRATSAGYLPWSNLGENLAAGFASADEVVRAWLESPAHRAVMLDPGYREAGIGIDYGGRHGIYWVLELGARW